MQQIAEKLQSVKIGTLTLGTVVSALVLLIIFIILIPALLKVLKRISQKSRLEQSMQSFLQSVLKVVLWSIAIMIIADRLGIPTTSLVTLLGVVGLALSLSVQGIISNLFSGVTILTTKPFISGNIIEIGDIVAQVRTVGLFYTTLITFDKKVIYVPNSEVVASKIKNYSEEPIRRVDIDVSASYDAPVEDVRAALLEAAAANEYVIQEPKTIVVVLSYDDNSIKYGLRAWTTSERYFDVLFSLNEAVREHFDRHGVAMSYPHVNVHMVD